ncbi:hypothetical protein [Microbacterium sp. ABRD28]|uniref:hypothetical protein n=1 Tax=Microbacterium sp. ABRD28 TaxID=2268461 RepID=UPI0013DDE061|nr:hypothetical protein [Microbacterium sp. ABRD28]
MDAAVPGRNPRLVQLVLAGLGMAIGWMLLSFVLGLSSSSALADESQDSGGLLSTVGTVVDGGAEAVETVAEPVTDTAGAVVGGGVSAVQETAEPVTSTATSLLSGGSEQPADGAATVAGGTDTVQEAAAPLAAVAAPVTDTVSSVATEEPSTVQGIAAPVVGAVTDVAGDAGDTVSDTTRPVTEPVRGVVTSGTRIVDDATGAVTGTAAGLVDGVTDGAGDLLDAAPLQPVVRPVAGLASTAVDGGGALIETVGGQRPVSQVVGVVTDVVEQTPVVGDIADDLGVTDAAEQLGGSVDDGVGTVGGVVSGSGENLAPAAPAGSLPSVRPPLPGGPLATGGSPAPVTVDAPVDHAVRESDATGAASSAASDLLERTQRLMDERFRQSPATASSDLPNPAPTADEAAGTADAVGGNRPFHTTGGSLPVDATAAGPGGASLGAWGLIAFGPLFAYRAWMRRSAPEDDRLPGAPIFETDASPD